MDSSAVECGDEEGFSIL